MSVKNLVEMLESLGKFTPESVHEAVSECDVRAEDIERWVDYDYPVSDSYGRKMVHNGGFFEVMIMSWKPGDYSGIHDHGKAEFGAVKIFGVAEHAIFKLEKQKLTTISREIIKSGTTLKVTPSLIHQMGNPGESNFFTLHVYGNVNLEGGITSEARIFDYSRNELLFVDGGIFYLLPENEIVHRKKLPEADRATRERDLIEASKRAKAIGNDPEYRRLMNEISSG
ncbi:MAG: cysteine dioxygenase family protein [Candidatus Poseidoniia archaeon]|jgi:predicted metal-dependent enzyme (double-stranded beta helix superfamily)|nr:cysteine dioxygenase family protein [Candidatus Poseidoniia archaeon]MDP6591968.1 cysteine dioxygenase family protein [Candidatus Poseidoniia archaeon]MDP7096525.1 cysteine dioxygenase family protein [Candidatus Poseidoniia archaeon]MDP7187965.1 cysteine dioxygenase family protein [Candidatus Poseidoniia archaeon]MDP7665424.1 cysteine dioxygenase family protein [Candidatus Poseidoniia archaeon]|tara:strand:+ start:573 stop:1250 length:678 start_codon:yes stop_codon:yes gene_type:complete